MATCPKSQSTLRRFFFCMVELQLNESRGNSEVTLTYIRMCTRENAQPHTEVCEEEVLYVIVVIVTDVEHRVLSVLSVCVCHPNAATLS